MYPHSFTYTCRLYTCGLFIKSPAVNWIIAVCSVFTVHCSLSDIDKCDGVSCDVYIMYYLCLLGQIFVTSCLQPGTTHSRHFRLVRSQLDFGSWLLCAAISRRYPILPFFMAYRDPTDSLSDVHVILLLQRHCQGARVGSCYSSVAKWDLRYLGCNVCWFQSAPQEVSDSFLSRVYFSISHGIILQYVLP